MVLNCKSGKRVKASESFVETVTLSFKFKANESFVEMVTLSLSEHEEQSSCETLLAERDRQLVSVPPQWFVC